MEERTLKFAKEVIEFVKTLPKTTANVEIAKQVIRSSSSVGEAKESIYWFKLAEIKTSESETKRKTLIEEATQLVKIFSSIVEKSK